MDNLERIADKVKDALGLEYFPVGMYFTDDVPDEAINIGNQSRSCLVPLILSSAKGKVVAFSKDNTGRSCASFYLGYKEWIFDGIECFLSNEVIMEREPERFIKTKEQAKAFVESMAPEILNDKVTVFKPLNRFLPGETPELVIFFANADQISGLVLLLHFTMPEREDLVVTRFTSGCGSLVTYPMKLKATDQQMAVWGMHDIAARVHFPANLMSLSMPFELFKEITKEMDDSFLITETWQKIKERNQ